MPKRRRTQITIQQCTPMEIDEDVGESQGNKTLGEQEKAHHVSNVIKYLIAAESMKTPIIKSKISKEINCQIGRGFKSVLDAAKKQLLEVFNYEMIEEEGKIILVNKKFNKFLNYSRLNKNKQGLLFIILAHIYMSGESCSEDSLLRFLGKLQLMTNGNEVHDVFGNVKEIVFTEFVKQGYISIKPIDNTKDMKEVKWGIRAKHEVKPRSVMLFISKVYNDRNPKAWRQQYDTMIQREQEANGENQENNKKD